MAAFAGVYGAIFRILPQILDYKDSARSWLTPYFSCVLVGLGLVIQFMTHLIGFSLKRRTA